MYANETSGHSQSIYHNAWKRLRRNKMSILGLAVIFLSVVLAILGYAIIPDSTPDANQQILELSLKPPGFEAQILRIRKNESSHNAGFFNKMLFGELSDFIETPIYAYSFEGNDIVYEEYTGSKINNGEKVRINLAQVIYPLDRSKPIVNNVELGYIEFYNLITGQKLKRSTKELQEEAKKNNIVTRKFILGTDRAGRDMLSRLIIGTRVSLSVGFIAVVISVFIGILLGALSGFFRGWVDEVIMWVINVVWSIPTLLLVIAITLVLGKGFWQVFIAVGLTMWVEVARVIRGQVMSLREKEFIEAGRALGYGNLRLIIKHLIPNVMGPVIVISASNFASAILIEAGLSFLGIGAQPPTASWGAMINAHRGYILADAAYLAFLPGLIIMIMVLAFSVLGNGLRDALDARSVDDVV